MVQMYYKIPPRFVEEMGLTKTLIKHPDGNYLASRAVMARIHPDIDRALEITGGITLTPDQARDDQMGIAHYPLPGEEPEEKEKPLYGGDMDNIGNGEQTTKNETES